MIIATDWSVTHATGAIRYIGDDHGGSSPSYATVLQMHRWLQDLADDATYSGDDEIDITSELPSDKKFDTIIQLLGIYNIDDTASEHLFGGSIIQDGGDEIYDGIINYGNADVQIQIIQNGAVLADDWWNFGGTGLNADEALGASHQFMLKVRTGGADIDGRRLIGTARRFGYTFSEFKIGAGTGRGVNTLALADSADLNNQTDIATVAGWTTITNTNEGYVGIDVNNDGTDEYYYSEWDKATYSINQFYERNKWLTRDGSTSTLYGLSGELFRGITHEITVDNPTGTFAAFEAVSWTGGTGQMLAINSTTAATKMWIQLLTGSAPTNGLTITGASAATADVDVTVTKRTVSTPSCGASTGSALIGAYGFGLEKTDLTASDSVIDLSATTIAPPNLVTYSVSGIVSGEDRVLVAPYDGVSTDAEGNPAIEKDQLSLNTTLSGATVTSVVVTTAIPSDTPETGTIRVVTDAGIDKLCTYTSWTGSTFTITSSDFSSDNATTANNVYITYIDKLADATSASFNSIFLADRNLVIVVRDGDTTPIKQFISSGVLGSAGGSISVIRTSDA